MRMASIPKIPCEKGNGIVEEKFTRPWISSECLEVATCLDGGVERSL